MRAMHERRGEGFELYDLSATTTQKFAGSYSAAFDVLLNFFHNNQVEAIHTQKSYSPHLSVIQPKHKDENCSCWERPNQT